MNATFPILQGRLRGKRWITGSANHGCWLGSYEHDKQTAFAREVRRGAVVFDIGAHVGFYTLLASELVGPQGQVVAFEPLPANLRYLEQHISLNGVSNVQVIECAVSDWNGDACFQEGPTSTMGRISERGGLRVSVVTLDAVCSRGQLPSPDLIKMDIEGGELQALTGARWVLSNSRPTVFLATHSDELRRECCEFLSKLGYRLQPIGATPLSDALEFIARADR